MHRENIVVHRENIVVRGENIVVHGENIVVHCETLKCMSKYCCALRIWATVYSSYLQQFGFFFILSNTVKSCLQVYVLQSSQKIYFFSKKKKLQYHFRFDFAITMVGFQFK